IEPPLLRRLRLEVGGLAQVHTAGDAHNAWHAGLEADLWFSRLAHVATPNQMTLRPAVLAILRDQLTDPRHHAEARAARAVVEDAHREHSDMIQLEELIIWATLTGHTDDVGAALDRALATLHADAGRATGIVRWFTQARRRIPPEALAHPA